MQKAKTFSELRRSKFGRPKDSRPGSTQRGYGSRWQKARKTYLTSNPLCVECKNKGIVTQATVVDHIIPHKGNQKLFWDVDNWQPLCKECHDVKTGREGNYYNLYFPSNLSNTSAEVNVVCGCVASGKSYFVSQQKKQGDIVIDLDCIMSDMSSQPVYQCDFKKYIQPALMRRNQILRSLREGDVCWLITSAPKAWQRAYWRNVLDAKVYVIETDVSIAKDRLLSDSRRKKVNEVEKFRMIERWWCDYQRSCKDVVIK